MQQLKCNWHDTSSSECPFYKILVDAGDVIGNMHRTNISVVLTIVATFLTDE